MRIFLVGAALSALLGITAGAVADVALITTVAEASKSNPQYPEYLTALRSMLHGLSTIVQQHA